MVWPWTWIPTESDILSNIDDTLSSYGLWTSKVNDTLRLEKEIIELHQIRC